MCWSGGQRARRGRAGASRPHGPPFAQAVVDNVATLDPAEPATVGVTFDGTDVHFDFGIPRGEQGAGGDPGAQGEVSLAQLDDALAGVVANSSANTYGVETLDIAISDPPTQAELQAVVDKLNEMLLAQRRP